MSPFCLYTENRRGGEEPELQLSPLNGDQTPFSTKPQSCLVKGLEGSGLCEGVSWHRAQQFHSRLEALKW